MPQKDFLSDHHVVVGLYPVADCFAGGVKSDVFSLKDWRRITFLVFTGAIEDAGISNLVTVEACDDVVPTDPQPVTFVSRTQLSSTTVDAWSALAARAATGYNFALANAVANAAWMAEVTAAELEAQQPGHPFVRLNIAETANKTITAVVIAILSEPRHGTQVAPVGVLS